MEQSTIKVIKVKSPLFDKEVTLTIDKRMNDWEPSELSLRKVERANEKLAKIEHTPSFKKFIQST